MSAITPPRRHQTRRPADPELLSRPEAAAFIGVSVSSLHHWSGAGKGPPFMKVGKACWYRREHLTAWMNARLRAPKVPS